MERFVIRRQSSLAAAKRILAQADDEPSFEPKKAAPKSRARQVASKPRAPPAAARKDASEADFTPEDAEQDEGHEVIEPVPKRRKVERPKKTSKSDTAKLYAKLFESSGDVCTDACTPPSRTHADSYHRPLLLHGQPGRRGRNALLSWFDSISTTRGMPWRKAWIDPATVADAAELRRGLEKRAYEVWISEIMLQQTRVAVVIDYWNRWMARWPTIQDLAAAEPEDVLSAWRGLGYYSRATRIHEAAKLVVGDAAWEGLMPADTAELEAKVPGVGRYTAGAISAIVFGRAAPMVDGNVLRVLSRQLGVFGNVKTDKATIDLLWAAADALVKAVARDAVGDDGRDGEQAPTSDRPGRWGQALMELGSTVCTPKPNCSECPITTTCRAYAEGLLLAAKSKKPKVEDIEDLCSICEPFEEDGDEGCLSGNDSDTPPKKPTKGVKGAKPAAPGPKQATLAAFKFVSKNAEKDDASPKQRPTVDAKALETVAEHARKFPLKVVKKAVREEEALVCAIRRADGQLLIHRRPEKGLLAGLWEFPSHTLPAATSNTAASRKEDAQAYASELLTSGKKVKMRHAGELGSVPWLFSHLKLTMHVHLFEVEGPGEYASSYARSKWASVQEVEDESMGTGMRKCWALVRERVEE
ncbi:Adenine DNA glycosylase [Colletotrichum gloeosporioides]|uniref:Adenine DNA glycosylase n=1 Tax=Colletotrichum gloeosporioides TaxID=474922 RepID=A0A8H4CDA1_COLGL|nr:Adenine DNA glycosylase [Colletotrichum gloeosporioides]KAF3801567.1 Adenine DNA glycosylase [Colletotrichum gloeosporioides]